MSGIIAKPKIPPTSKALRSWYGPSNVPRASQPKLVSTDATTALSSNVARQFPKNKSNSPRAVYQIPPGLDETHGLTRVVWNQRTSNPIGSIDSRNQPGHGVVLLLDNHVRIEPPKSHFSIVSENSQAIPIAEGATNSTNMKYAAVEVNDSYSPGLGGSDLESVVDLPVVTGENGGVVKIMVAGKVVTEGL